MFGYFKLDDNCPAELRKVHKKYYCLLCRGLKRYYGVHCGWLLSYDVSFFLMLTEREECLPGVCKVCCHCTSKSLTSALAKPQVKNAAALNILLTAAKLEDDILDENSVSARMARLFYGGAIRKAKNDAPEMWEIIRQEYDALRVLEKENGSLEALEDCFARMMLRVARECFGEDRKPVLDALETAAKWLYFIDAADDLDRDLRRGSFNPFAAFGSFRRLKNQNYLYFTAHLQGLFGNMTEPLPDTPAGRVAWRMLCKGIPKMTLRVLTGRRGRA